MSNYIFLTENSNEGNTVYLAIEADKIEQLTVSSTYDQYGQSVDASDAGDYLTLDTQKAVDVANTAYNESEGNEEEDFEIKWNLGDSVTAYDDNENGYDTVCGDKDLVENVDYTVERATCHGFNFWDGSNWQTVVTEASEWEGTHSELTDEKLIAELNEAIENKTFVKEGFGAKIYEANGWTVENNYCQGEWSTYRVYEPNNETAIQEEE